MTDRSPLLLSRLLTKLSATLSPDSPSARKLHTSPYERNRVGTNLEHARTLLLTLERQSTSIRTPNTREAAQSDLKAKRDIIKGLNARLEEITRDAVDDDDDEGGYGYEYGSDSDEGTDDDGDGTEREDLLRKYAPARQEIGAGGLEAGRGSVAGAAEVLSSEIRARGKGPAGVGRGDNLGEASTTAREDLFAGRNKGGGEGSGEVEKTEQLMSHNRVEQETLTTGLLGLAQALKESSLQFGASLEAEKDVVKRAEGGLDKSAQGMEAAEKRMGMLRRMSEGQGWWGRIKLYGFIFALWVACFLLVFIGPKLRF